MSHRAGRLWSVSCLIALIGLAACSEEEKKAVPVEKSAPGGPQVAAITPQAAKAAGILIAVSGPADIRQTIALFGTVKSNGEKEQNFRARYPGTIRTVRKSIGDAVVRGGAIAPR